jgi:hypothetical protein
VENAPKQALAFPLIALDENADGLHPAAADPWWREAWYFEFYDPKFRIQFQTYQGVFPNQKLGDLTLAFFHHGRLVHQAMRMDYPLAPGPIEQRLSFAGLRLELVEPFRLWRIRYEAEGITADLEFEGIHAPYSWAESRLWMESNIDQQSQHFDQLGRYRGHINIGGDSFTIDCLGFRDRMYGWGGRKNWVNYVVLWSAFHPDFVTNVSVQTFADGSHHLCGYLYREGRRSLLSKAAVELHWDEANPKIVSNLRIDLEDNEGRKTTVYGRPQGVQDTTGKWLHRKDNMLFTVGQYECEGMIGHGVMNWAFLDPSTKPTRMEAQLGKK